tara:strand:- start:2666 stop:3301 length:636 start_codon:yes stop_codon:yes gene_type:complete
MSKKVILFGTGQIAEVANYYFSNDSDCEVVAFTINEDFIAEDTFCSLPIVPFEKLDQTYSINDHYLFIALSYSKLNSIREAKYLEGKSKGYKCCSYVSSKANIFSQKIGENCFILENNVIQPFTTIGNNVTLWSGNHIGHHSIIQDHAFISSHVVVSGNVKIGNNSFLGVNATIRDGISIGSNTIVGAGCLILEDIPNNSLVKGVKSLLKS